MYREFDAPSVQKMLGIDVEDTPDGLILHGIYDMPQQARRWRDRLAEARVARKAFNIVIGNHEERTIWYAPVLGGPMAALVVHCAAVLGVRGIIQIGSFGGTRRGMKVGELLLATNAGRGEAASDWYLEPDVPAEADETFTQVIRDLLTARELDWHEGSVFTTSAFMAEEREDILRWESEGYVGVEMEAATTFAIAQHFGVPSACLIYLLDNLIEDQHLLGISKIEQEQIQQSRKLVEELALDAIISFTSS
jgi:uridine phosphorylase